jgi:hypothetical protein
LKSTDPFARRSSLEAMVSSSPSPSTEVTEESSSGGSRREGRWEETVASSMEAEGVEESPSATETEEEGESPSPSGGSVEEEETVADRGDPWEGSGGGLGGGRKEQGS